MNEQEFQTTIWTLLTASFFFVFRCTFDDVVMMPVWIFTLGKSIFEEGEMKVPYAQIATYTYGLLIPLAIGLLIQRYCPKIARFLVRILKTGSAFLIIFIVVFAIATNLYLFKLFTWEVNIIIIPTIISIRTYNSKIEMTNAQNVFFFVFLFQILIAGLLLPLLGYFVGWLVALLFKQEYEDRLAIAVEAGIQNTGIAIFVLGFALGQPQVGCQDFGILNDILYVYEF